MYKLIKNIKYRLVIGATIGTMAGGAFGIGLNNAFIADGETPTYPFVRDNIDTYGVTTHKYYIDDLKKGKNEVRTFPSVKDYISSIEKKNSTNENNKSIKSIELTLYSPYIKPTNDERINIENSFIGIEYLYSFPENKLTKEWLEEILDLYEAGEIEYLISNSICVYKKEDYTNISETERNNSYISAELTIKTVDYNDIQVIKQSKEENSLETFGITSSAILGTCIGIMAGSLWEYKACMSEIEKSSSKAKKLTKAKK